MVNFKFRAVAKRIYRSINLYPYIKMIKIAVFTTTRGDMAILSPLLLKMNKDKKIKPLLFVGGTHLNENFGKTVNEIKSNKLKIEGFLGIEIINMINLDC